MYLYTGLPLLSLDMIFSLTILLFFNRSEKDKKKITSNFKEPDLIECYATDLSLSFGFWVLGFVFFFYVSGIIFWPLLLITHYNVCSIIRDISVLIASSCLAKI